LPGSWRRVSQGKKRRGRANQLRLAWGVEQCRDGKSEEKRAKEHPQQKKNILPGGEKKVVETEGGVKKKGGGGEGKGMEGMKLQ